MSAPPEHQFNDDQVQELKEAFTAIGGGGQVSVKELMNLMRGLGLSANDTELADMLSEVDMDCNGTIDFPEFLGMINRRMKDGEAEDEFRQAFQLMDKDRDGKISIGDLKKILAILNDNITDDEAEEMMRIADSDKDGSLNFQEFMEIMRSK
jgi:calmodulin